MYPKGSLRSRVLVFQKQSVETDQKLNHSEDSVEDTGEGKTRPVTGKKTRNLSGMFKVGVPGTFTIKSKRKLRKWGL